MSTASKGGSRYLLPRCPCEVWVSGCSFPSIAAVVTFLMGSSLDARTIICSLDEIHLDAYHTHLYQVVREACSGGSPVTISKLDGMMGKVWKKQWTANRKLPLPDIEPLQDLIAYLVQARAKHDPDFGAVLAWVHAHCDPIVTRDNRRQPLMGCASLLSVQTPDGGSCGVSHVFGTKVRGGRDQLDVYGRALRDYSPPASGRKVDLETMGKKLSQAPAGYVWFYSTKHPEYAVFSNFHNTEIVVDGRAYQSVEHYFQAMKFDVPTPTPAQVAHKQQIISAKSAASAAKLGRRRDVPISTTWDTDRVLVMKRALQAKHEASETFREVLKSTGDAIIVERSPFDRYWGDGCDCTPQGSGKNMLGVLLMQLRDTAHVA